MVLYTLHCTGGRTLCGVKQMKERVNSKTKLSFMFSSWCKLLLDTCLTGGVAQRWSGVRSSDSDEVALASCYSASPSALLQSTIWTKHLSGTLCLLSYISPILDLCRRTFVSQGQFGLHWKHLSLSTAGY